MVQITGTPTEANLRALIPFLYIIPSLVLYLLCVIVIFFSSGRSKFQTSFYTLFSVSSIGNVLKTLFFYFCFRTAAPIYLPFFGSLPETGFLLTVCLWLSAYLGYFCSFAELFIAFNRFTVIKLSTRYTDFWIRWLKYSIVLIIVAPCVFTFQYFLTDVRIRLANESNPGIGYRYDMFQQNRVPWMNNARNYAGIVLLTAVLSFLFNSYLVYKLFIKNKSNMSTTKAQQEKKLTFYSIFILINQIILFIQQIILTTAKDPDFRSFLFATQGFVLDIFLLTPIYFMLFINKTLRIELLKFVGLRRLINQNNLSVIKQVSKVTKLTQID